MKKILLSIIYFLACILITKAQTLYSTTQDGGSEGAGTLSKFIPSTNTLTVIKSFKTNDLTDGSSPTGSLMKASDGKLYGITAGGGSNGFGVIFSFDPSNSSYSKLMDFDSANGGGAAGNSLIQASGGKLYGMTAGGGSNNMGVIFSFDPSSSTYTKLMDFNGDNGTGPLGSLVQANDGKLYGVTFGGGNFGYGVIFSFDPSSFTYTKLKDIDEINDADSRGSLMQASDGNLYGMAYGHDRINAGTIYSFDPSSLIFADLVGFDFDNTTGSYPGGGYPVGDMTQASDGKLYGMTAGGGGDFEGVIFSYDLSSSTYTKLKDLDDSTGSDPLGNLLQASDGKLYGMTHLGGRNLLGTIFSYDPSTSTYTKLMDYDGSNGSGPDLGSGFVEVPEGGPLPVTIISFTGKNIGNSNQLSWKVANEQNLNYYELQRSTDGQNFKDISQIKATGNNSYTYSDPIDAAMSSIYYYRLKSVDEDNNFKYSEIVQLKSDLNGNFVMVNPNPFKDRLVVTIASLIQDNVTFALTDMSGRQLLRENKQISAGTKVIAIDGINNLSKGTYLLTIIKSNQSQTIKVVKGN